MSRRSGEGPFADHGVDVAVTETPRRRWRWPLITGAVVVVVIAAAIGYRLTIGSEDQSAERPTGTYQDNPPDWAPVDTPVAVATVEYLDGVGAPVVQVLDLAGQLARDQPSADRCRDIADQLDGVTDPDSYRLIVADIPDPVLGGLAASTATALTDALVACVEPGDDTDLMYRQLRDAVGYTGQRRTEVKEAAR